MGGYSQRLTMTDKTTIRQAKLYLAQIGRTDRLIQRLTDTVGALRRSLLAPRSELKPDKVQTTTATHDTMAATVVKIVDLEREIDKRIDGLVDQKADALRRIDKVFGLDRRNVLIARYVNGLTWEAIAANLNYSVRHVLRLHSAALCDFAKKNPDVLKDVTLCHY